MSVWSDVSRFLIRALKSSSMSYSRMTRTPRTTPSQKPNATLCSTQSLRWLQASPYPRHRPLHPRQALGPTSSTPSPQTWNRNSRALNDRLADLEPDEDPLADNAVSEDVLAEFRQRLEADLSEAERREIVQLLVRRITVHTTVPDRGRKHDPRRYRLPLPACSPNSHGHRCESQLQSQPRYRRLIESPFTTHRILLQGQAPVSPGSSFPS